MARGHGFQIETDPAHGPAASVPGSIRRTGMRWAPRPSPHPPTADQQGGSHSLSPFRLQASGGAHAPPRDAHLNPTEGEDAAVRGDARSESPGGAAAAAIAHCPGSPMIHIPIT